MALALKDSLQRTGYQMSEQEDIIKLEMFDARRHANEQLQRSHAGNASNQHDRETAVSLWWEAKFDRILRYEEDAI